MKKKSEKKVPAHTYESDVQVLIGFAKDQGWDVSDVAEACARLEEAIEQGLTDYSWLPAPPTKGVSK